MSSIYHSGYGYSKKLCEDATSWFLNKYYPRHKIDVDIVHRGLKRESVLGYCDVIGRSYRPRYFLIELQSDMYRELYIKIFARTDSPGTVGRWFSAVSAWKNVLLSEPVENYDYKDQPHEIEARDSEIILYDLYMSDKQGIASQTGGTGVIPSV